MLMNTKEKSNKFTLCKKITIDMFSILPPKASLIK